LHLKKTAVLICAYCFSALAAFSYAEIHSENNAYRHNNKGLIYLKENNDFAALKEFQIAIDLMPNAQASAVYYVNAASVYEKAGRFDKALAYYEKALSLNHLYFDYYLKTAECYKKLGIAEKKLIQYKKSASNPLNSIMTGLLYIQTGKKNTGITLLDDFCVKEPDLIVTQGVREYINKIVKEK